MQSPARSEQPRAGKVRRRAVDSAVGDQRRDTGQAAVELALALPLVLLVALGIVQVAIIARDQLAVAHAAREAARAASVHVDPSAAAQLAVAGLHLPNLRIATNEVGGEVLATASMVDHTDVPLIGWLLPDVTVTGSAAMMLEPP